MSIILNNGVQNVLNTPAAITDLFANRPSPLQVSNGTLFFAKDTLAIYQCINSVWVNYSGGGGGGTSTGVNGLNGTTNIGLGGTLTQNTLINNANYRLQFINAAHFDLAVSNTTFQFSETNIFLYETGAISKGLQLQLSADFFVLGEHDANVYSGLTIEGNVGGKNDSNVYLGNYDTSSALNCNIFVETQAYKIETLFGTYAAGLYLNLNSHTYKFGDYNNISAHGNSFVIDDISQTISTYQNAIEQGIKINNSNKVFYCGDFSNSLNLSSYYFDYYNGVFEFTYNGSPTAMRLETYNSNIKLGDLYLGSHQLTFQITDITTSNIGTYIANNALGFLLNFTNNLFYFGQCPGGGSVGLLADLNVNKITIGDNLGNVNSSTFGIDDSNQTLIASSNLIVGTSGSSSGNHLKINVGGNDYVIELKNP